jgi:hypothetical protein
VDAIAVLILFVASSFKSIPIQRYKKISGILVLPTCIADTCRHDMRPGRMIE